MISEAQIEDTKRLVKYSSDVFHSHNDSVIIAYHWLDAQKKLHSKTNAFYDLKHWIERWGGFYVSTSDVEVAAFIHPEIHGYFPHYNIGKTFVEPSIHRLENIRNAFAHGFRRKHYPHTYKHHERYQNGLFHSY